MTQNRWGFPLIIVVVLVVTSLLTVIFPAVTRNIASAVTGGGAGNGQRAEIYIPSDAGGPEQVEIKVDGYLLGEELVKIPFLGEYNSQAAETRTYGSLGLLGIITAIVIGGLVAFTIPIAGFAFLARAVNRNAEDKSYEAAQTGLTNRIDADMKEQNKEKPVTGKPETHYRPGRDGWAAGIMLVFLAYFLGLVLGDGISDGLGRTFANLFALATAIGSYFYFRPARMEAIDQTEYGGFNRGLIWVFLSGALMMGLGVGLMYIVISGGDPFPWLEWTPGPRIDWEQLRQWLDDSGLRFSEWN